MPVLSIVKYCVPGIGSELDSEFYPIKGARPILAGSLVFMPIIFVGAEDVCRLGVKKPTPAMRKKDILILQILKTGACCSYIRFISILSFIQIRFIQNVPFLKKMENNYHSFFSFFGTLPIGRLFVCIDKY